MDIETADAERIRHAAEAIRGIIQRLDIGADSVGLTLDSARLSMSMHGDGAFAVVSSIPGAVVRSQVTDQGRDFRTASVNLDGVDVTAFGK